MADARSQVRHDGIGSLNVPFFIDNSTITYDRTQPGGSAQVGFAVTMSSADKTVQLVGDGEAVVGKLISVEKDGVANIQIAGYMELPGGVSAALTLGKKIVGDLGPSSAKGYIQEVATDTAAQLGVARGFISANDNTAKVGIWL